MIIDNNNNKKCKCVKINNIRKMITEPLIYEFIKDIRDPEKDFTLEELEIIDEDSVSIDLSSNNEFSNIKINWKPTVPNCHLALNIGLCIRKKLEEEIRSFINSIKKCDCKLNGYKYKLDLYVRKGSHIQEEEINRQLNDKERYAAAIENPDIVYYIKNLID